VKVKYRKTFISEVHRVLKPKSTYFLTCFSYRNGPGWNNFTKEHIVKLFGGHFTIKDVEHVSSLEADRITRYLYEVLMKRIA
jgi:ubiquinone/menaquinone biosynthesis C-methylase UbiE